MPSDVSVRDERLSASRTEARRIESLGSDFALGLFASSLSLPFDVEMAARSAAPIGEVRLLESGAAVLAGNRDASITESVREVVLGNPALTSRARALIAVVASTLNERLLALLPAAQDALGDVELSIAVVTPSLGQRP